MSDPRQVLSRAAEQYRKAQQRTEQARQVLTDAVIAALRAGIPPTDVAALSLFSDAHVRVLAREHGIPPAPRGGSRRRGAQDSADATPS